MVKLALYDNERDCLVRLLERVSVSHTSAIAWSAVSSA
jgi:hypothetical protein